MTVQQFTDAVEIDGSQDITQLKVQGHSTQTEPLQVWEDSAGDEQAVLTGDGRLQVGSFDNGMMATDDSLIEAHRDENDTAKPKRGLHLLGEITGTLDSLVSWAVQELVLKGTGGISALHSALRVRLTNENTGTMASGADLRGADVEVINNGGSNGNNVPEITGLRVGVTNQAAGYADTAYGLKVELVDDGSLDEAYAIHTDQGVVHLGDELELKIFDPLPDNDPVDTNHMRLFATVEEGSPRLYGKVTGADPELIAGGGAGSPDVRMAVATPESDYSTGTYSDFVYIDSTGLALTLTPRTSAVWVGIRGYVRAQARGGGTGAGARSRLDVEIDGNRIGDTTYGLQTLYYWHTPNGAYTDYYLNSIYRVTGLTPNQSHTFKLMWRVHFGGEDVWLYFNAPSASVRGAGMFWVSESWEDIQS